MKEIVEVGKAVRLGISEATLEQIEKAHAIHPVSVVQSEMSLWTRDWIEAGVVGWCAEEGAAFIPYAPLGRGYRPGHSPHARASTRTTSAPATHASTEKRWRETAASWRR
jgi:aryl-alcohol dehydrogenase-like predicted oxidoreductase